MPIQVITYTLSIQNSVSSAIFLYRAPFFMTNGFAERKGWCRYSLQRSCLTFEEITIVTPTAGGMGRISSVVIHLSSKTR